MAFTVSGLYVPAFRDALDTSDAVLNLLLSTNKVDLYLSTFDSAASGHFDTYAAYNATDEVADAAPGYDRDTKQVGGTPTWASSGTDGLLKYSWSTTVQWTAATFTAAGMVLHTAAANLPICGVTFGGDFTCTAGTFTVTADAAGIFSIDMVP
jgi:hypothetical protein